MKTSTLSWITALIAAIILLQTLWFKFSGANESIYIFTTLGIEPYGRIGSGITELIAAFLLLIPKFRVFGALIGFGVMSVAILSHLTVLGITVQNDRGQLFGYALIVLLCCAYNLWIYKANLLRLIKR